MTEVVKESLLLSEYEKYSIPQGYKAFSISFTNISQEQCDDLEYEYTLKGYKIFNINLEHSGSGKFDYTIILAKSSFAL